MQHEGLAFISVTPNNLKSYEYVGVTVTFALIALGMFSISESQSALSEVMPGTAGNVEGNMEVMLVCFFLEGGGLPLWVSWVDTKG